MPKVAALCTIASAIGFYFSLNLGSMWPLAWVAPIPVLWLVFGETRGWIAFAATWTAYALGCCNILPAYKGTLPAFVLAMALTVPALGFAGSALGARYGAARFASRRRVRFRLALDDLGLCGVVRSERDGTVACLQPGCCALPDPGRFRFWTLDHHIPARPHSGRYCDGPAKEITNASACCDHALRIERRLRRFADFVRR